MSSALPLRIQKQGRMRPAATGWNINDDVVGCKGDLNRNQQALRDSEKRALRTAEGAKRLCCYINSVLKVNI